MIYSFLCHLHLHTACEDVDLSSFPHARLSSYSFGVVNGSEATIVCEEGYRLTRGREKISLRCGKNHQSYIWYNVITLDDGSETLRESWSAPCYPDQCKLSIIMISIAVV